MPRTVRLELVTKEPSEPVAGRPPLLFVHGVRHAAWCWEAWQDELAARGWASTAVSLRGHGRSDGAIRRATLGGYVHDIVTAAARVGEPPVLVGHSMGGILVQRALHRTRVRGAVLVAPAPAHNGLAFAMRFARSHPLEFLKVLAGRPVPFERDDLLSREVSDAEAERVMSHIGSESAWAQYQITMPRRPPKRADCPLLILATPDDAVIPTVDVKRTARLQGTDVQWFPGLGHDLMLEPRGDEPLDALVDWVDSRVVH